MKKALLYVLLVMCVLCMAGCAEINPPEDGYDVAGSLSITLSPINEIADGADSFMLSGKVQIYEHEDQSEPVLEVNAEDISATLTQLDPLTMDLDIPYEGLEYSTGYYLDLQELQILVKAGDTVLETQSILPFTTDTAIFTTIDQPPEPPLEDDPPEDDPPEDDPPQDDPPQDGDQDETPPENDPPENDPPEEDPPQDIPSEEGQPDDPTTEETLPEEDSTIEQVPGTPDTEESLPATGDESGVMLWLILAAASLMGLVVILRNRKRA